jgi:hypothetical protein
MIWPPRLEPAVNAMPSKPKRTKLPAFSEGQERFGTPTLARRSLP